MSGSRSAIPALLAAALLAAPLLPPAGLDAVAHGEAPDVGRPLLRNVTAEAGLGAWVHAGFLGEPGRPPFPPEAMAAGGCWADFDSDGWLDLYLLGGLFVTEPERNAARDPHGGLFRNERDGTFREAPRGGGADLVGLYMGCAAADYDDDGRPDLYVLGYAGNVLLRNLGGMAFANVTDAAGVRDATCTNRTGGPEPCWSNSASWLDYDKDGCLDLFVDHRGLNRQLTQLNSLFRSRCDGTFEQRVLEAGLLENKESWSSVAADLDHDGWTDLYVSNDGQENDRYLNNRDGTFRRVPSNADDPHNSMGTCVGDLNDDDAWDIATTNYVGQHNGVFRAEGSDYVDMGDEEPFTDAHPWSGWGCRFYDLNNDGLQDLMVVNSLPTNSDEGDSAAEPVLVYEQRPAGGFQVVRDDLGDDLQRDFAARDGPWGDYDNDGGVDVVITESGDNPVHLFRAEKSGGNFLNLDLVGTAPGVTRDAVGARVRVSAPGLGDQFQEKMLGTGFGGSDDPRLHFGLRDAGSADVLVTWPDGSQESLPGVRANSFVRLAQGQPLQVLRELPMVGVEGPSAGERLASLTFTASATPGEGAGIARYDWDLGDGASASGPVASHAFTDVGTFFVKATATDTLGRAKTWQHRVHITDRVLASVAFDADPFLPHEALRGNVSVTFPDGAPVRAADVRVVVTHSSGSAVVDGLVAGLPRFVRDLLGYTTAYANLTTDAQGRAHFEVRGQQPLALADAGYHAPGRYVFSVAGSVRGSLVEPARATATVVAALPGP